MMKTLRALNPLMMMAAAIAFAACDNEELPTAQGEPLQILVEGQDFTSSEPQLRASGNPQLRAAVGDNYRVNFTDGDEIGIFSLASDGTTILDNNVPYSYQSGIWQQAGTAQAYRRTGASYVAYFPYNAANNGKTIVEIVAAFTPPANQSNAGNHTLSGLMTGTETLSGATLNITLNHALSLLEISLPPGATGVSISLDGGTDIATFLYPVDAETFRYVVKPAATATLSGKYTMGSNSYLWSRSLSLEAGKYARVSLKHTGDGTATDPYCIYTLADMQKTGTGTDGWTLAKHYKLMTNLALGNSWTPIGDNANRFTGSFDGDGHTLDINGVNAIDNNSMVYAGLFGVIGSAGTVMNLSVSGTISNTLSTNVFFYAGGIAGMSYGTIERCFSSTNITANGITANAGGIAGDNRGKIRNCFSTGSVTTYAQSGNSAGGIVSIISQASSVIENCYSQGAISTTGLNVAAGIAASSSESSIFNCVSLNSSISSDMGKARIVANVYLGTYQNNYGKTGIPGSGTPYGIDGDDCADTPTEAWWGTAANWKTDGGASAWDFTNTWIMGADGYPKLRVMKMSEP
ncbi:hypothetical protein AGMMS50262_13060 [Bacteroidia bacterium]|nr:hypothetical protein AGMMS50262_13060 [Bacteroidia bacterium]